MTTPILELSDLHVTIEGKPILNGITLRIMPGEIHAIMGPNGSGKSTLSNIIAGHPSYTITKGSILFEGKPLNDLEPDARSRLGIFLAFQYPMEIPGVGISQYLYTLWRTHRGEKASPIEFQKWLKQAAETLSLDPSFIQRHLNVGFSGGEKKRAEILQMLLIKPKLALLDETDSGLDIDSLQVVAKAVNALRGPEFSALVVTHYQRILQHLRPDVVHVLMGGKIVATGTHELAQELEKKGYGWLNEDDADLVQVA